MPDPVFERLAAGLRERGVPQPYARRLLAELEDHFHDLEHERHLAGDGPPAAAHAARGSLGADDLILSQVLSRPELTRPDGWCGSLALPFAASYAEAGSAIARWGLSISLGALLTFGMLFALASTVAAGA